METKRDSFLGTLLIAVGVFFLVSRLIFRVDFLSLQSGHLWPIFVLGPGLIFELSYFATKRNPGVLVPGGILTTIGLLFFFEVGTNWRFSAYTWPVYIVAVAVGLFQLYLFGGKNRGPLIAALILSAVAGFAVLSMFVNVAARVFDFGLIIPLALIITGLLMYSKRS